MKPISSLLVSMLFVSASFGATTKKAMTEDQPKSAAIVSESTKSTLESTKANTFYISTNIIDLTKSNGNVSGDFFINEKFSANLSFKNSSNKEKVKAPNLTDKVDKIVERNSYTLGFSYFPTGTSGKVNFVLNPGISFGSKRNTYDVENQTGLNLKATALVKPAPHFGFEAGLRTDNLEDGSFIGDLYAGIGYLF